MKTPFVCTGCQRLDNKCVCGRARLNRCVGCGNKLWKKQSRRIHWGNKIREICLNCAGLAPQDSLVDGAK